MVLTEQQGSYTELVYDNWVLLSLVAHTVTLLLGRQKQEDCCEFESSLEHRMRSR